MESRGRGVVRGRCCKRGRGPSPVNCWSGPKRETVSPGQFKLAFRFSNSIVFIVRGILLAGMISLILKIFLGVSFAF